MINAPLEHFPLGRWFICTVEANAPEQHNRLRSGPIRIRINGANWCIYCFPDWKIWAHDGLRCSKVRKNELPKNACQLPLVADWPPRINGVNNRPIKGGFDRFRRGLWDRFSAATALVFNQSSRAEFRVNLAVGLFVYLSFGRTEKRPAAWLMRLFFCWSGSSCKKEIEMSVRLTTAKRLCQLTFLLCWQTSNRSSKC